MLVPVLVLVLVLVAGAGAGAGAALLLMIMLMLVLRLMLILMLLLRSPAAGECVPCKACALGVAAGGGVGCCLSLNAIQYVAISICVYSP